MAKIAMAVGSVAILFVVVMLVLSGVQTSVSTQQDYNSYTDNNVVFTNGIATLSQGNCVAVNSISQS